MGWARCSVWPSAADTSKTDRQLGGGVAGLGTRRRPPIAGRSKVRAVIPAGGVAARNVSATRVTYVLVNTTGRDGSCGRKMSRYAALHISSHFRAVSFSPPPGKP
ncbi:hypothetical protein GCM10015535_07300 [Streptomyces gelaticus]|uniref:Uncharacterized protein n=1 Tax=Streptomyces gelaticus TaxID=285446 RepID=A0ABQ2VSN3_9ACTN|nr:hypothetical protein GCM10015535_07300 [Streptomyces gelaticus]